jgi:hypothetical protein
MIKISNLSTVNNIVYLKKVIITLGVSEPEFFNANVFQLKKWEVQISENAIFLTYSKAFRNDLKSALRMYINCRISH